MVSSHPGDRQAQTFFPIHHSSFGRRVCQSVAHAASPRTAYYLLMAMTFDATLKDMGRECPSAFLATFDQPPALPVKLLNVDLSTVTALADLILGLGDPLVEIVQLDFQSSAAA
jgi:hypothetical protein